MTPFQPPLDRDSARIPRDDLGGAASGYLSVFADENGERGEVETSMGRRYWSAAEGSTDARD